jgi:two-component system sensor histidine kinase KdpD
VYLPHQAERAIRNFFRKGNLIALRELSLRRTADRVDEQMLQYRRDQADLPVWQTRESLLACIGPGEGAEKIVRAAARIANHIEVPWHVIYVETPELQDLPEAKRHRILRALKMAQDMGADTASLAGNEAVAATVKYARDHNLSQVVVGRDHARPWRPWYRSYADRLGHLAPDLDVIQVARTDAEERRPEVSLSEALEKRFDSPWQSYVKGALICAGAAAIAAPLHAVFDLANIVMLFLLAVVLVAVRYGRGPAVMASFLGVAAFDFLYVPPRFSFAVSDVQYLMTFAIMLGVGLIIGQLTASFRHQARVATSREGRVRALYEMSRDLSAALLPEQIAEICDRFIDVEFDARSAIILADEEDKLRPALGGPGGMPMVDLGIAQWAFDHGEPAGRGTDTLAGSPIFYVPLKAPMRIRGVLALEPRDDGRLMAPEQRRLLDTFARLIAIAIERVHYVDVAQTTTVAMESERLRNSLLAAISHDLRTPLAALVGLAESITMTQPPPTAQQDEIALAMREEARRMSSLVDNLLDMARLQAGKVQLNRQWHPLEEIIGSALKAMAATLARHRVTVRLEEDLPLLELDAVLIERLLCNLLENAAKYTPAGSTIEIGTTTSADSVDLWLEDNGPGLPPGKEEDIFKKFERGMKESPTPGVGLGLAICKAIAEAHGGAIRAVNREGGGARFVVALPRGTPPAIAAEEEHP